MYYYALNFRSDRKNVPYVINETKAFFEDSYLIFDLIHYLIHVV